MLADATMSLDNVVALAAIAGGNFWLLALGVLISIPIIAYGALILSAIIRRAPEIIAVGAAFLGWIAGAMAVSDPLVAGWVQADAPALGVLAPALVALFVLVGGERADARVAAAGGKSVGAAASRRHRDGAPLRSPERLLRRRLRIAELNRRPSPNRPRRSKTVRRLSRQAVLPQPRAAGPRSGSSSQVSSCSRFSRA